MHIDPSAIDRLRQLGERSGQNLLGAIVASFQSSAPEIVAKLSSELDRGRFEEVRHLTHTLRGSAATFGALRLVDLCRELNARAQAEDVDRARDLIPALNEVLQRVLGALATAAEARDEP